MERKGRSVATLDDIINFPLFDTVKKKLINYKGLGLCNESGRLLSLLLVLLSCAATQLVSVSWFKGCEERGNSHPCFSCVTPEASACLSPSPVTK